MNIFYTDKSPKISAVNLCNSHCVKMILESAQMLSTAHAEFGSWQEGMYKPTHKNHPSSVWVRSSIVSYKWLYDHLVVIIDEYHRRYNKTHKTESILGLLEQVPNLPQLDFTQPPQCMPDEYKTSDSVIAYRKYYKSKSNTMKRPMIWYLDEKPEWWNEY